MSLVKNKNRSRMLQICLATLFLWLCGSTILLGQSRADMEKPSGLAVEVASPRVFPFSLSVYSRGTFETSWSGDIPRTYLTPTDNNKRGLNIQIKTRLEGDAVRVEVRVGLASFREVEVATYLIRPDEKVVVDEVVQYGFAPFALKVIRVNLKLPIAIPPREGLPEIDNNVPSIKIVGLEKEKPADMFLLSLENTSTKNILALEIVMPTGGTSQARGYSGKPLISSRAIYKTHISAQQVGRITGDGFESDSIQPKCVINAALFEDGTYEGDYGSAAIMESWRRGREIQIERIILLLDRTLKSDGPGSPVTLEFVKDEIYSLGVDGDASAVDEISRNYPPLKDRAQYVVQGIKDVMAVEKYDLIYRFKDYEQREYKALTGGLRSWLKRTKADYESLLKAH